MLSAAWAQNAPDVGPTQTVPVGQTFKNFEFPFYENGKLKWTATASQATGITQNRAEALDIKIKVYDENKDTVTMTITSPDADIYVSERKMRSSHTVDIIRSDMEATAQTCDFDMAAKKYILRTNVKVTLKNFDAGTGAPGASAANGLKTAPVPAPAPMAPRTFPNTDSLLESPGTMTNNAPMTPAGTETK